MTDLELMQQARDALVYLWDGCPTDKDLIERLDDRLAQPEPEPVAWTTDIEFDEDSEVIPAKEKGKLGTDMMDIPLYIVPPQREWQGLTLEEREELRDKYEGSGSGFISAIEAKLKEKNT